VRYESCVQNCQLKKVTENVTGTKRGLYNNMQLVPQKDSKVRRTVFICVRIMSGIEFW
jgi:hypothetical protein